jgi:hypothetical protein
MVLELETRGAGRAGARLEQALPGRQALHQPEQRVAPRIRPERGRHVGAVQPDGHVAEARAGRHPDPHQHVAPAQLVRPVRQGHDLEPVGGEGRGHGEHDERAHPDSRPEGRPALCESSGAHQASSHRLKSSQVSSSGRCLTPGRE